MITYRQAKKSDASEIKKLLYETWTLAYEGVFSKEEIDAITSEWHSINLLEKQIKDKETHFHVAKKEDRVVGICNATFRSNDGVINIQRLHVLPSHHRQGIGTKLTNITIGSFSGAKTIELEVEKKNKSAVSFYKKYGFSESGKKEFEAGGVKIPCIVMQKLV